MLRLPAIFLLCVPPVCLLLWSCLNINQGLFTKLLYGPGEVCTSDALYCFTGAPGKDTIPVFDVNADDKYSSMFDVDTRYGGGGGVGGELEPPFLMTILWRVPFVCISAHFLYLSIVQRT